MFLLFSLFEFEDHSQFQFLYFEKASEVKQDANQKYNLLILFEYFYR